MDLKLTFVVVEILLIHQTESYWKTFNRRDWYGVVNATHDSEKSRTTFLRYHFEKRIEVEAMIRIDILHQGNSNRLLYTLPFRRGFITDRVPCYYFSPFGQSNPSCNSTATAAGCKFIRLTRHYLYLEYNEPTPPRFVFRYEYRDCFDNPLFATTAAPNTTADRATGKFEYTAPNNRRIIGGHRTNSPIESAQNPAETLQPLPTNSALNSTGNGGVNNGVDSNVIVIIVVIAIVTMVALIVIGWVYAKRKKTAKNRKNNAISAIQDVSVTSPKNSNATTDYQKPDDYNYITPDTVPGESGYEEPDGPLRLTLTETPEYQTVTTLPCNGYAEYDVTGSKDQMAKYVNNTSAVTSQDAGEYEQPFHEERSRLGEAPGYQTVKSLPDNDAAYADYDVTGAVPDTLYEPVL